MTITRRWWYRIFFAIIYVLVIAMLSQLVLYKELLYDKLTTADSIIAIKPGTSFLQFANQLHNSGYVKHPRLFAFYGLITGKASKIKAGEYLVKSNTNLSNLLKNIIDGRVIQYSFSLIEGMTFNQILHELHRHPKIDPQLHGLSKEEIIARLGIEQDYLEGLFMPETYYFPANTSDIEFLQRAYKMMQDYMERAWEQRDQRIVLKTIEEALILASILEKETGVKHEYGIISGVFQRRLANSMRLQADPTIVYALGDTYKGKLLKSHLKIKSPYNTYINSGLPPTPIAIPSLPAIDAALHPSDTEFLYFVATGTGEHMFSKNLNEHNNAVKKYRVK